MKMLHTQNVGVGVINGQCYKLDRELDWKSWEFKRGEIYLVNLDKNQNLSENKSSIFRGTRPVLVVSNDINNRYSTVIQIVPITSSSKVKIPVHVKLDSSDKMKLTSFACIEQTKCIEKNNMLINGSIIKITELSKKRMCEIDLAIRIQFGLV